MWKFRVFIGSLVLVAVLGIWNLKRVSQPEMYRPEIGGEFVLHHAQTDKPYDSSAANGKYRLVYFGFSFCPDICPTGLTRITELLSQLSPEELAKLEVVFITLDPQRDTAAALTEYLANFDAHIIGLTGTQEQIAKVAKQYGVFFKTLQKNPEDKDYAVDHSSYMYVLDTKAQYLAHFGHDTPVDVMLKRVREVIQ